MRKYNSTQSPGPVMGKADKYWTLWIVQEPHTVNKWFGSQVVQRFDYQQNLSYDKESALEKMEDKFDNYRIDETLRSNTSFSWESAIEYKEDIYLFGKYKGQTFSGVNDRDYEKWYYSQVKETEKDSPLLKERLSNLLIEYAGEEIWLDDLKDKALKVFEEKFRKREHIGKVGETYEDWVRLRRVKTINTSYGMMTIWELVDRNDNLIFYKGSKDLDVTEDQIVKIKGKIKHEEYYSRYHGKTVQETSLKYPKIIKK